MDNKLVEIIFILFRDVIGHLGRYLSVYKIDLSIGPCVRFYRSGPTARAVLRVQMYMYLKKVETAQHFVETAQYL